MTGPLGWTSAVLALLGVLVVCALALRRVALAREERRRLATEERLRPFALALVEGDSDAQPTLSRHDSRVLAALLTRYARQLSGGSLRHIGAFFESNGSVERELANLSSRRAWRRASSAYALGGMASQQAVPALLAALSDPSRDVAAAAARSLGHLGAGEAVEPLVYALVRGRLPRAVCAHALLSLGAAALPSLRTLLAEADADPDLRTFVVELIGLLGDPSDAVELVGLLRDPSAEVRARGARALGRLGAEEASLQLREALSDRIPFVRANVAHALGAIRDRSSAEALLAQARDDGFDPAHAAAEAVARINPDLLLAAMATSNGSPQIAQAADVAAIRT